MQAVKLPKNGGNRLKRITDDGGDVSGLNVMVPKYVMRTMHIMVKGKTPLICHAWSKKAVEMMLAKQMGLPMPTREKKDPLLDFKESLYYLPDNAGLGVPAPAFKACIVSGANEVQLKMTEIKRCIHVQFYTVPVLAGPLEKKHWSDWDNKYESDLKWYHDLGCGMRMDLVRLESGVADIRFRGWFPEWSCKLEVEYSKALTPEQVVNLFQSGGEGCGIGEWRPSSPECRSGEYGRFSVV